MVNCSPTLDVTFAALASPARRRMVAMLAQGSASVSELARPFDFSLPAASKHLRVLEEAGLVVREKEGRVHRCTLVPAPMDEAAAWLEEQRAFWEGSLDSLVQHLERERKDS